MTDSAKGTAGTTFTVAIKWAGYVTIPKGKDTPSASVYRHVLTTIMIHYMDWDTWACRVANATVAERTGLTDRSVRKATAAMESAGLLSRVDDRPGQSNTIRLNLGTLKRLAAEGREESEADAEARKHGEPRNVIPTPRNEVPPPPEGGSAPPECHSTVSVYSPVKGQSSTEPPYPPAGGGREKEEETMNEIDDDLGAYTEAFKAEWDEAADKFYPGQTSQLWDGGKPFISPKEAQRQAHIFEHGRYLPGMLKLYVAACDAGDRAFGQRDFSSQATVNMLRAWAERGTVPFWAKKSKGALPGEPELTKAEDCINIGGASGDLDPASDDDHIEWS